MKWDIEKLATGRAEELPRAAIVPDAGNSHQYRTGGWRSERPYRSEEKCTQCLLCWIFCPDSSVIVEDEKVVGFDLDHCKGCGICASECPTNPKFGEKAIVMVAESCELPEVG